MPTNEPSHARASNGRTPVGPSTAWKKNLYLTWVAQLLAVVGFTACIPYFPFYIRELGVTDARLVAIWAGLLLGANGLVRAAFGPIWGLVADHYGRRIMVLRAMFGGAVLIPLMAVATNVYHLLILRILQGAITGTIPAAVALVSSFTPPSSRGYSLGVMQMAVYAGAALGPSIGGVVADWAGYRLPFALAGLALFAGGVIVLFGVNEPDYSLANSHHLGAREQLREVTRLRSFRLATGAFLLVTLAPMLAAPIFPLFVEHILGRTGQAATTTGLVMAAGAIAGGAGAMLLGRLGDRIGHTIALLISLATSALAYLGNAAVTGLAQLFGVRVAIGLSAGGTQPLMNALVASLVPESAYGRAYGFTFSAQSVASALAPVVGGFLASHLGLRAPFVAASLVLAGVAAALAAHMHGRTRKSL